MHNSYADLAIIPFSLDIVTKVCFNYCILLIHNVSDGERDQFENENHYREC